MAFFAVQFIRDLFVSQASKAALTSTIIAADGWW
jgi:hypothetical protein